jgi:chromosomal replication initiation ATPase DnaA
MRDIKNKIFNSQLALPLSFKILQNRENFILSESNKSAVKLIEKLKSWQINTNINSIPAALIYGPSGCGKTHLSHIYKQSNNSLFFSSIASQDIRLAEKNKSFILDDFSPGNNYPSETVMHFLNEVKYNSGSVLILSKKSAHEMDWGLPDLNSRLRSLMTCKIELPDDILLYTLLIKYADEKKIILNDKQCIYILDRVERNFETIIKVIDHLDRFSLETKKKITLNMINNIITSIK